MRATCRLSALKPNRSSRASTSSRRANSHSSSSLEKKVLDGKRRPATAGALRVGVLDHELCALQAFLVVDLGAGQILVTHRIDEKHHAVLLHHGVVLILHLIEREAVLEA